MCEQNEKVDSAAREYRRSEFNVLAGVTTIAEASVLWGVSHKELRTLLKEKEVKSVKAGGEGEWLISVRSMIEAAGLPAVLPLRKFDANLEGQPRLDAELDVVKISIQRWREFLTWYFEAEPEGV